MSIVSVYVTAADAEEARRIARTVIAERLAACANITERALSIYWWEGEVQEGTEAVLILKTVSEHVAALIERVKALHSYECPCIEVFPVADGNEDFLDWVAAETRVDQEGFGK